jgi:hypothetical protein
LSLADAATLTIPLSVAPPEGAVIDTVGGVISAGPGAYARIVPAEAAEVPSHEPAISRPSATIGAAYVAPPEIAALVQSGAPVCASYA